MVDPSALSNAPCRDDMGFSFVNSFSLLLYKNLKLNLSTTTMRPFLLLRLFLFIIFFFYFLFSMHRHACACISIRLHACAYKRMRPACISIPNASHCILTHASRIRKHFIKVQDLFISMSEIISKMYITFIGFVKIQPDSKRC